MTHLHGSCGCHYCCRYCCDLGDCCGTEDDGWRRSEVHGDLSGDSGGGYDFDGAHYDVLNDDYCGKI